MSNHFLNLHGDYSAEVLSYYLWGQAKAPAPSELADPKWMERKDKDGVITLNVDIPDYLDKTGVWDIDPMKFNMVKKFFANQREGKKRLSDLNFVRNTDGGYTLTYDDFVAMFYDDEKIRRFKLDEFDPGMDYFFYNSSTDNQNFAKNAFTFGSTKLTFDKNEIRFIFDREGNPLRIENFRVIPANQTWNAEKNAENPLDNFDFAGGTGFAQRINHLLKQITDPSGIGKKVEFNYVGDTSKYSKTVEKPGWFNEHIKNPIQDGLEQADNLLSYDEKLSMYLNELRSIQKSGVIDYLDENGKIVLYATDGEISGTKAKNADLSKGVLPGDLLDLNHYHDYFADKLKNGITYVGGQNNDTITGTEYNDRLLGATSSDTLKGLGGKDHMEGGIGFDTYHIEDEDTVFDSDGKGKLVFKNGKTAGQFERIADQDGVWRSEGMQAIRQGNDLKVSADGDSATIQNFFAQAAAGTDGSLSLLGITLADAVPTEERPFLSAITYTGEANLYNTFNLSGQQRFNIIGGSKDDLVFATGTQAARIDAGAGNDRIYGSYGADTIYGGSGSDYINGSPGVIAGTNRTAEQQAEDRDFLVGGAGRDVVVGMAGDDIIHTGEVGEHLLTAGSGEAGDVASGGLGDDKIYGSIANDLLAGSEGGDTVYGGAGDDVILGDALYRLTSRSLTVYQESTITGPEYGPGIIGTGYIAPPSHHTPRVGMEHNYSNGKWAHQVTNVASRSHPDMEKWTVSIDREKGDYAFSSPIPATNEDHRLAAGGGADYLYGGYGNDLIIGQDGNDFLYGESGNDILWGDDNRDLSVAGDDYLDGGDDNDTLYGGGGTDTLIGGRGSDTLYGGTGFDTYLFHASDLKYGNDIDTIDDEDGQGRIVIDGTALDGLTWQRQDGAWRSGRFSLSQTGSELHVAVDGWQNGITVRNFANGTLGLNLPAQQPEPPAAQPKPETPNPRLPETPALPDLPAETKPQEPSVNPDLPETPILPTNPSNTEQPLTPLPPNNPGNPPANAEPATPPAEPNHPIPTETPVLPTNPSNTGGQIPPMLPDNPAYSVAPAPVVPPKPVKAKRRLSVFSRRKEQVVNSYSSWKQKAEDKVSSGILSWKRRRAAKKAATATAPIQPQQPATILPPSHSPFKRHRRVAASVGTSAALAHIPQQAVALTHAMAAFGNGQGSAASGTVSAPSNPAAILTTPSV